jgi:hypothetical protein
MRRMVDTFTEGRKEIRGGKKSESLPFSSCFA